ncbi:putative triacylglycerol lipase [Rosa chinensis]|uniref:Putative triacylglycerol lipase n=1 Tax=Rosa chinensis TaxID=74649 RepID=A0A2P6Q0P2_ROSCH|nr:putative triacylglycerol lipase [Rosa chinensis]
MSKPFNLVLNIGVQERWSSRIHYYRHQCRGILTGDRIELDKSIKPEDTRYKAALSIMAAKSCHTRTKISFNPSLITTGRGTAPFDADAWRTDFDISWCEFNKVGKTHSGFMKALGLQPNNRWPLELETDQLQGSHQHPQFAYYTIRQMLKDLLQEDEKAKFILTGHSLGGALAILFARVLDCWQCMTVTQVGDGKFGVFMKEKFRKYDVRYMRYVYSNDLVPRIPYDDKAFLFKHFGPSLYYNSCYGVKVLKEEPNKNYLSLLWFIPKRLNAVWELLRSFILPLVRGSDYKEGWL